MCEHFEGIFEVEPRREIDFEAEISERTCVTQDIIFNVLNGIDNITKVSTEGLVDTYRIKLANGTEYYFTVTNGEGGVAIQDTPPIDENIRVWLKPTGRHTRIGSALLLDGRRLELLDEKDNEMGYVILPESGLVDDVKVNNVSVVTNKIANIDLTGYQPVGDYATNTALTQGLATKQDIISDLSEIRTKANSALQSINSTMVVNALGYTPYSNANPSGYQTSGQVTSAINTHNIDTTAHNDIRTSITTINGKIPAQATTTNQLADKAFVNSSISTNTANFIGTFNSVEELEAYAGTKTPNDYAFVITEDEDGNTVYNRYKWTGTQWLYEYSLNNSSFTAQQWNSINSGITDGLVALIETSVQPDDISDMATKTWVGQQSYQTSAQVESAITSKGYTTMSAVEAKGYLTLATLPIWDGSVQ